MKPEEIRAAMVNLFTDLEIEPKDALEACMFLAVRMAKDFDLPRKRFMAALGKLFHALPSSREAIAAAPAPGVGFAVAHDLGGTGSDRFGFYAGPSPKLTPLLQGSPERAGDVVCRLMIGREPIVLYVAEGTPLVWKPVSNT